MRTIKCNLQSVKKLSKHLHSFYHRCLVGWTSSFVSHVFVKSQVSVSFLSNLELTTIMVVYLSLSFLYKCDTWEEMKPVATQLIERPFCCSEALMNNQDRIKYLLYCLSLATWWLSAIFKTFEQWKRLFVHKSTSNCYILIDSNVIYERERYWVSIDLRNM